MPLPRSIARANRRVTNRLLGGLATRLPGFGVVIHTGRRSRRQYRTPVNVFRRGDRYIIALTYGSNADWVRNVLANRGCMLETRGRTLRLSRPRLFHDESRYTVPAPVRLILGMVHVCDFLELNLDEGPRDPVGLRGAAIGT
jgi:deazaflavin-dependent oxidoreductase (nitroreductase family)